MARTPNYVTVLRALHTGVPVRLFGKEVFLSTANELYFQARCISSDGTESEKMLGLPSELHHFLNECENLPEDYMTELRMQLALTEHNRSRGRRD